MKTEDNPSAFPWANDADKNYNWINRGMTLRDYFAAKAMQADLDMADCIHEQEFALVAKRAYKIADAMLKAR